MSKKKIAELEARIVFLEQMVVESYLWVGVKPTPTVSREYSKVFKRLSKVRNEIIGRED
jgi:hypothetical protein